MDISNNSYICNIICAKMNNDNDYHKLLEYTDYEKVVLDKMDQIKQHDELKENSNIFKRFIMFIWDIVKGIFID